jgi:two-component SAPR family response regulator
MTGAAGDEATTDACRRLVALHGSGFLPAVGDAWTEPVRDRYYKIHLVALEKLAAGLSRAGRHQEAVEYYRQYIALEPLAESVRVSYWKTLAAMEKGAEARRDASGYARLVRKELGAGPGQPVQDFLRRSA